MRHSPRHFSRSLLFAVFGLGGLVALLTLGLFLWADLDALLPILMVSATPIALFVLGAYLVRARLTPRPAASHHDRAI
jgi:lipopolysaccharide export LptBFGC system permease protein LptF